MLQNLKVTGKTLIVETAVLPSPFPLMCSLLLKDLIFNFYLLFVIQNVKKEISVVKLLLGSIYDAFILANDSSAR